MMLYHRQQRLILLILLISICLNIFLVSNFSSSSISPLFKLNDNQAEYQLENLPSGEYSVLYKKTSTAKAAFVGSTRLSLDEFIGKKVIITGRFRSVLGFPLCLKRCNYSDEDKSPVIDIKNVQLLQ